MDTNDPTARLTEREKEVLRAWLAHKTAKEIAMDIGVSHHAVEKRLKLARVKLDAGSSLEAARILAQAEGYQPAVTGSADLFAAPSSRQSLQYRPILIGGIAMSFTMIVALGLIAAQQPAGDPNRPAQTGTITLDTNMGPTFDQLDENGSGYLENPESPFVTLALIEPTDHPGPESAELTGGDADPDRIAEFYDAADTDRDGRVSFREFHVWNSAHLADLGVETTIVLKDVPASGS
ncbi:LuxR C-terminal-related transcriptional regulator [Erythrobacter sanguineus]|jgi:DNA-binding CsgD family transcriptional regulator|uniref:DNA-binding transcriptional regulator, CsgD family n=1 Tax=Erythrobacter sanguineus TaxID=198312 RepID=A0A1M7RVQ9_9SPHN|nr:LuxR C-terminal-related transcriptional regulator [Erythrobacter sanguineus]SHN50082.1 DNA-binding transcriptional regulator, CsgD family [Erythrobacter sanguineus]